MVLLDAIMDALGDAFPWELAGPDDAGGLLIGSRKAEVGRAMCSIEITTPVIEAAIASGCDLLVAHHPHALARASSPLDLDTPAGKLAHAALEAGLNVIAVYKNADTAVGGAADLFSHRLALFGARPLVGWSDAYMAKVVVFVPVEAADSVAGAMFAQGAGVVGDYSGCSFRAAGTGTYTAPADSAPYAGVAGEENEAEEVRLEMICPSFRVHDTVDAMLGEHPYEEVAWDVYRTEMQPHWGFGRIGNLPRPARLADMLADLAAWSSSEQAVLTGDPEATVGRVAVAPGPADRLVEPALRQGAELLAAGEASWHATVEACEAGLALLTLGHLESERALVPHMIEVLQTASSLGRWGLEIDGYRDRRGIWG